MSLREEVRDLVGHFIEHPETLLPYFTYLFSHMYLIHNPSNQEPNKVTTLDLPSPKSYVVPHNKSIVYKFFCEGEKILMDSYMGYQVSGDPSPNIRNDEGRRKSDVLIPWEDLFVVAQFKGHKCKIPYYSTWMVPSGGIMYIQPLKPIYPDAVAGFMDALFPNHCDLIESENSKKWTEINNNISSLISTVPLKIMNIFQSPKSPPPYTVPRIALQLLFQNYLDIFSLIRASGVSHEWSTISSSVWSYRWNFHFPTRIPKPRASLPNYNWKKYFFRTVRESLEERLLIALVPEQEREYGAYWSRRACSCGKTCQNASDGATLRALMDDSRGFLDDNFQIKAMDMVRPTLYLLKFMKKVNRKSEFSEFPVLESSLYRYIRFLDLCNENPEEELIPTLDIDVCWQAHLIRTKKYRNYCYEKFGRSIDRRIFIEEEERLKKLEKTEYLWKITYGEEYHVPLSQLSKMSKNENSKSTYLVTPEEIIKDRDWLDILNAQYVKLTDFDSEEFLVEAIGQYQKFLEITAKFPQVIDGPGPTHPVDLVWHCHQMHPHMYERDCMKLMKKIFDHDPWPHERLGPEEFEKLRLSDRQLWRDEFKEEQWVWA